MNESITRAAGSGHGQEWSPEKMEAQLAAIGRPARMRTTLYGTPPHAQKAAAFGATSLAQARNESAAKRQRSKLIAAVEVPARPSLFDVLDRQVFLMAACD